MMRTIEVKNGVKCFGEQQVLRDVSIQCASGHIYGSRIIRVPVYDY